MRCGRAEIEGMMAIVVRGDAMSPDDVAKAFAQIEQVDAVVSTIGGTPADPSADSQAREPRSCWACAARRITGRAHPPGAALNGTLHAGEHQPDRGGGAERRQALCAGHLHRHRRQQRRAPGTGALVGMQFKQAAPSLHGSSGICGSSIKPISVTRPVCRQARCAGAGIKQVHASSSEWPTASG